MAFSAWQIVLISSVVIGLVSFSVLHFKQPKSGMLLLKDSVCVKAAVNARHSKLHSSFTLDFNDILTIRAQNTKKYAYPYNLNGVDKRSNLSQKEFLDVYDGKWPVIITDVVPSWPATNWTTQYFLQNYGEEQVVMKATTGKRIETLALPLRSYLSHITESSPASWTYLQDELFLLQRPELRRQILKSVYTESNLFDLFPPAVQPWDCMLLWGTAYSRSTLHIDPYNWTGTNAVIFGHKKWKLIPPGQDKFLSISPDQVCGFPLDCQKYNSHIDAFNPSEDEKKLLQKVNILEVEQGPGEMLFIPTGWFHQAYNVVPTLAVSGQLMNENNYLSVLEEILKGGSVRRQQLPQDVAQMSSYDLVKAVMSSLSEEVLRRGAQVTRDTLDQMAFNRDPLEK
ncbi:F-box protein At1g78280 [Aplysia californica]|uniref:F-box protein At1g78280 n=1 Tax=Aplysia californica TaxID=6500 RepID=A0ABM0JR82_APLCA|nr:F-box protein At1g78280 [Aplysia californica]